MAKPYSNLSKTEFRDNYNVIAILTDKTLIMKQLQTFNPDDQAVAFGVKKGHRVTLEDIMDRLDKIDDRLGSLESNQAKDHEILMKVQANQTKNHELLLRVIKLNNLKY